MVIILESNPPDRKVHKGTSETSCLVIASFNKNSTFYHFTYTNSNIYKKPIEPEDIFYYFVSNIKSDFYIMRHSLIKEDKDNLNISRFASLSNADFPSTPKKSNEDKKQ